VVADLVEQVAHEHRVEQAQEEVEVELEPGLDVGLVEAAACWNSSTRNPSKPAVRSASRYSASYMPNRHGPQAPAVRNT
jgi:hypothetical protein